MRKLLLASSSRYRQVQLAILGYPFEAHAPDIIETPLEQELPDALALRLAYEKADAISRHFPDALVIGSDQVAFCEGLIIGKPGTYEKARQQLLDLQGKTVSFYSAIVLTDRMSNRHWEAVVPTLVRYRQLTHHQIDNYLQQDTPFDCAGSFKSESLGIALLDSVTSDDPTALVGLPLISLTHMLAEAGVDILAATNGN